MSKKKILALVASLAMVLPVISTITAVTPIGNAISASATSTNYNDESDFTLSYDTENKTATIVKYVGDSTDVVIPPTVQNGKYTVTTIGEKAFYDTSKSLTSIQIPETITTIEDYAIGCYYYRGYETADIYDDVIGYYRVRNTLKVTCASTENQDVLFEYVSRDYITKAYGFRTDDSYLTYSYNTTDKTANVVYYCTTDVTDVVIPETVNGYTVVGIGQKAFYNTSKSLTSITLPSNVSTIEDYAIGCYYYRGYETADIYNDVIGYYRVNNNLQVYYTSNLTETALFNYMSNEYMTTAGGIKSPILIDSSDVTTEPEEVDPYANYIFDVNQDGDVNSVDLLLLKKRLLQMI